MIIESKDTSHRAILGEEDDGVHITFLRKTGWAVYGHRATPLYSPLESGVIDAPFHVVRDELYELVWPMTGGLR